MKKINYVFLILLYGFTAMVLLAPLASDDYLPSGDFLAHTAAIIEAKNAIRHYQFPIRVAPHYGNSEFYPYFQFYSPFPYSIAGLIHKLFIANPFLVLKMLLWFSLTLGGFFVFRLCYWLTESKVASMLAGVVYLLSPYLIINATIRGDFTESVAQGLLPIALYYSLRLFKEFKLSFFLLSGIMWSLLLTTHLITFAYGNLFLFLFLMIYALQERKELKNLLPVILSMGLSTLLVAWFIAPLLLYSRYLFIYGATTVSPAQTNWLTPLTTLLSLRSISPVPLPGKGQLLQPLYFSVGIPIILSFGMMLYAFFTDKNLVQRKILIALMTTFVIALFATWSPFDFWIYLPKFFGVVQFSYRILTQVMWMGAVLFAFMLVWLFKNNLNLRTGLMLLAFILISSTSWMYNSAAGPNDKIENAYQFYKDDPVSNFNYRVEAWRFSKEPIPLAPIPIKNCIRGVGETKVCQVNVKHQDSIIALPILYFPNLLQITVDNQRVEYFPLTQKDTLIAGIKLNPGQHEIVTRFTGLWWANWLSLLSWLSVGFTFAWIFIRNRRQLAKPQSAMLSSASNKPLKP